MSSPPPSPGSSPKAPTRSVRHVKAAARILQREARKILRKHADRIAPAPADAIRAAVAGIDTHRVASDWKGLEEEAERLDELLQQHASFARKSAVRETVENIAVAVLIALGLRSCFYEPFKIPSSSMMPTLRKGDHIFVNKFVYGIQIPFTSTVVGESLGDIERGDVVVFRYPIQIEDDFIKRVIGLPGDEVKVVGREVSLKRAGESRFEVLARQPLDEPCYDDEFEHVVQGCQLFEETLGDKTYVVRYLDRMRDGLFLPEDRVWKVPPGHLLVMGDNRDESHDSLAWTIKTEAVAADRLLRPIDLREVTAGAAFSLERPETDAFGDPKHDTIVYASNHRSKAHDLALAVWRAPSLGDRAMYEALAARVPEGQPTSVAALTQEGDRPGGDRVQHIGASIDALTVGRDDARRVAVAWLEPSAVVFELSCGVALCPDDGALAEQLTGAIARYEKDHRRDAAELVQRASEIHYGTHETGRRNLADHHRTLRFREPGAAEGELQRTVTLQAFRKPKVDLDLLQDAALRGAGSKSSTAARLTELGPRAYAASTDAFHRVVATDADRRFLVVLDCGVEVCRDTDAAAALARRVWPRVAKAASDTRSLSELLVASDLPGLEAVAVPRPELDPFDRVTLEATVSGRDHSLELEVWRQPPQGLDAWMASLRQRYDLQPSTAVAQQGASAEEDEAWHLAFVVPGSESVVRMRCRKALCPTQETALALARRVAATASDPATFVDPEAERPRPFVPRGNVKGRAERIWWPPQRFWLPIR